MGRLLRVSAVIAAALAVPIVPFLLAGPQIEAAVQRWTSPRPSDTAVFWITFGVLSTDVFLPIPSSLVSTLAGVQLPISLATLTSWLGLSAGACLGFAVARTCGRPIAIRLSSAEELSRMEALGERFGSRVLVLCRALPVLAEASVLLIGATGFSWRRFIPPVALGNLGIAVAYSSLGHLGHTEGLTLYVLSASIALPLAATTMVRWWWPVYETEPQ